MTLFLMLSPSPTIGGADSGGEAALGQGTGAGVQTTESATLGPAGHQTGGSRHTGNVCFFRNRLPMQFGKVTLRIRRIPQR